MTNTNILVTGGAGYIGSHTVLSLVETGWKPIIYDDFSNSSPAVISRLKMLAGCGIEIIEGDCRDANKLRDVFRSRRITSVLHFAGLKSVGESVADPLRYYDVNVNGFLCLLSEAQQAGVNRFVFSSSATVYAPGDGAPLTEASALGPINPYGRSKLICEDMARDTCLANPDLGIALMRYFNPIGAHPSGQIGESPQTVPNNLMPYMDLVATNQLPHLIIHGDDYSTPDGTGVRDYIHVCDLAQGHVDALRFLNSNTGIHVFNLGTGQGTSVLEAIRAYEAENKCLVPFVIGPRRPGDQGSVTANPSKARAQLGFFCRYSVRDACAHSFSWRSKNPKGFC